MTEHRERELSGISPGLYEFVISDRYPGEVRSCERAQIRLILVRVLIGGDATE